VHYILSKVASVCDPWDPSGARVKAGLEDGEELVTREQQRPQPPPISVPPVERRLDIGQPEVTVGTPEWCDGPRDWEVPSPVLNRPARSLAVPGGSWSLRYWGVILCLSTATLLQVGLIEDAWLAYQDDVASAGGIIADVTLNAHRWAAVFQYDHRCEYLVKGVSTGFDTDFTCPIEGETVPNYHDPAHEDKITAKLQKEIWAGRMVVSDYRECWYGTALSCVDKDCSGFEVIRMINDLSRPEGLSVNDHSEFPKYSFTTVSDVTAVLQPKYYMCKVDCSDAYRSLPVAQRLWKYFHVRWGRVSLRDLRVMFGWAPAPGIFTEVSSAVNRRMRSEGHIGTFSYIDDFISVSASLEDCWLAYNRLREMLIFLGLKVNEQKCVAPTHDLIFLGIRLQTDADGAGSCVASIDPDRVSKVVSMCATLETSNYIKRSDLEHGLGVMNFCAQVIWGARLYMRSAYGLLHRMGTRGGLNTKNARLDFIFWQRFMRLYNGRGIVFGVRRLVTTDFFSVDASTSVGMGGFLDGDYFSVDWEEVKGWRQRPWSPFRDEASSHINYLELFVLYFAFTKWGPRLAGMTVTVWTDNTATLGMVTHLWGTTTFIPLLKQLWLLMVRYDIRIRAKYISTKANVISDALSRGDWKVFAAEVGMGTVMAGALSRGDTAVKDQLVRLWRSRALVITDYDDWMLAQDVFEGVNQQCGPFQLDACVDDLRSNTQCTRSWNKADDASLQDWAGLCVYCNPPFSFILPIIYRFLIGKVAQQLGTSAAFVLPMWVGSPHWDLVVRYPADFVIIRRFPASTQLFTSPNVAGSVRKSCGPTRWPVAIVWVGPGTMSAELCSFASALPELPSGAGEPDLSL